jgi:bilirubin oxidase
MTLEHLSKGIGGFIIVKDAEESALALPRTYGIDDIPLMLTSRRYNNANQFVV